MPEIIYCTYTGATPLPGSSPQELRAQGYNRGNTDALLMILADPNSLEPGYLYEPNAKGTGFNFYNSDYNLLDLDFSNELWTVAMRQGEKHGNITALGALRVLVPHAYESHFLAAARTAMIAEENIHKLSGTLEERLAHEKGLATSLPAINL